MCQCRLTKPRFTRQVIYAKFVQPVTLTHRMRYNRTVIRMCAVLIAAAAMALSGCSSSGSPAASSGPAGTTAVQGTSTASGTAADPATTKAIAKAYSSFFDPKASLAVAEQNLQHGPLLKAALLAQAHNSQAQGLSARVTAVTVLSPDSAAVHFDLLSGGKPLLPDTPGNAVREDGRWKVAARTFCALVQLTGHPPAACSDPKITDLPN